MKTLFAVTAALIAAGAVAWAGSGSGEASTTARKVAVCHKTNSSKRPYQRVIAVGVKAIAAHQGHRADIIPAPKSCPQTILSATGGGVPISVSLRGVSEQPEPADPDGAGTAEIRLRAGQGQLCFSLNASNITLPAAGAHIHRGNVDQSGDIVVQLTAPGSSGTSSGCVSATRQLVTELLQNRTAFYVNVHTTDFAAGAIRGQLARPSNVVLLTTSMNGGNEKPNAGDPDGTGLTNVQIFTDTARLCYTIAVANIQLPSVAAHIHRGPSTDAGPVVVPFQGPGATGTSSGCVTPDATLVRDIAANPANFYSNVHTRDFGGGAVRGQLSAAP
jgi:CHRD domain